MSKLIKKALYGIKNLGSLEEPNYVISGLGMTYGRLLRGLAKNTFATGLDSNNIFGSNLKFINAYAGDDRIGRKVRDVINGQAGIDTLGRRSFRRLAKVMNANARTQKYVPALPVLEEPVAETPVSPVLEKPTTITKADLAPTSNEYSFGEGFTGDWANRARLFYEANKDNPAWKAMAGNDNVITADEMIAWLESQGLHGDAKLGRDTAGKMGVSDFGNYGWMNVKKTPKVTTDGLNKVSEENAQTLYTGYYSKFKNANAASLRRAYEYYSRGGAGNYYDKASGRTFTPEGNEIYNKTVRKPIAKKQYGFNWRGMFDTTPIQ